MSMQLTSTGASRVPAEAAAALRRLVYRSRATVPLSAEDRKSLLMRSRARNHALGIDGVLIWGGRSYLQVLEGPAQTVARLARSIARDPRHADVDILSDAAIPRPDFSGWDMHLAGLDAGTTPGAEQIGLDPMLMCALGTAPERLPALLSSVAAERRRRVGGICHWRPEEDLDLRAEAILRLLIDWRGCPDPVRLDVELAAAAPGLRSFVGLMERCTVALGGLWGRDGCDGMAVGLALTALLGAVRRRVAVTRLPRRPRAGRILVATQKNEPHILGAVLKAEMLRAAGFEVATAYGVAGDRIAPALAASPRDALVLVTSRVFSRRDRMGALRAAIAEARAVQRDLRVVAGGSDFAADPGLATEIGADAAVPSAAAIDSLLDAQAA